MPNQDVYVRKIDLKAVGIISSAGLGLALLLSLSVFMTPQSNAIELAQATKPQPPAQKRPVKPAADAGKDKGKDAEKEKAEAPKPEPPIEDVVSVTTDDLYKRPNEYLKKNVKFQAKFYAFSSLALDYKPAMRKSKDYLSFLVLRPDSHIPFSEIKLAMAIPKEKDPKNTLLQGLKDGDTVEIIGNVFATPLDEPWVDVLKLTKIASAPDDKKASQNEGK